MACVKAVNLKEVCFFLDARSSAGHDSSGACNWIRSEAGPVDSVARAGCRGMHLVRQAARESLAGRTCCLRPHGPLTREKTSSLIYFVEFQVAHDVRKIVVINLFDKSDSFPKKKPLAGAAMVSEK